MNTLNEMPIIVTNESYFSFLVAARDELDIFDFVEFSTRARADYFKAMLKAQSKTSVVRFYKNSWRVYRLG